MPNSTPLTLHELAEMLVEMLRTQSPATPTNVFRAKIIEPELPTGTRTVEVITMSTVIVVENDAPAEPIQP